ncbi:ATP-binding protein [Listeria grandensis]|uniref:ATP-binding protein n=1 Tax=Listeria grandensis TaxID=1494963 RepID=A0A7X0Y310_9LIST|nr:ATP-binding protein [Listeria grandensis]MBC1936080.1 ATP-binding protein [Listeria grandensis]MBC6316105.1 ATP-binding protein [Listeria grandensis]
MNRDVEISIPAAKNMIQSLRAIGYDAATAITDLIDNSIDAKANKIEIFFLREVIAGVQIIIKDNGVGMCEKELQKAMTIGSKDPSDNRGEGELGRFGMGLKTASFFLGRRLSIVSRSGGHDSQRSWDLDHVYKNDVWELFTSIPEELPSLSTNLNGSHGTIVTIDRVDKFFEEAKKEETNDNRFNLAIDKMRDKVSLVYHRVLEEDGVEIFINDQRLEAWDPFFVDSNSTKELESVEIDFEKSKITISPYIIPNPEYSKAIEGKQAGRVSKMKPYDYQGIYLYRAKRLIRYGDWMGILKKDMAYQLARVRIDIDNNLDDIFQLDIKKTKIKFPNELKKMIRSVLKKATRESKASVYFKSIALEADQENRIFDTPWDEKKINKEAYYGIRGLHPLRKEIETSMTEKAKNDLNLYLQLIAITSPSNVIISEKKDEVTLMNYSKDDVRVLCNIARAFMDSKRISSIDDFVDVFFELPGTRHFNKSTIFAILAEGGM